MNISGTTHIASARRPRIGLGRRESGFTIIEVLAVLAIIGIAIAFIVPRMQGSFSTQRIDQAYTAIVEIIIAGQKYRQINGSYDSTLNIKALVDNGYGVSGYTTGTGENVYNLDTTIAQSGSDAQITYEFDEEPACEQVEKRVSKINSVSGTPACSGSGPYTLTFKIY